jgi:hypothetical protein
MVDYVSKWVEAMPCCKASTEESIAISRAWFSLRYSENLDKRWRNSLHREEFQKVLFQVGDWT